MKKMVLIIVVAAASIFCSGCNMCALMVYNTGTASDSIDDSAVNTPDVKPETNVSLPMVP